MGGGQPQRLQQPQQRLEDKIMEMRMTSNKMIHQSKKSLKESEKYKKKAKQALKKNDQEGAKLYLQSAVSRYHQSVSIRRMALKLDFISANMKNTKNNQAVMNSLQTMSKVMGMVNNPNFEVMAGNMQSLQQAINQMLINGKMMQQLMNQQNPVDDPQDNMLQNLKKELAIQTANKVNQAGMIKGKEIQNYKINKNQE